MKKVGKIVLGLFVTVFIIIDILLTVYLLSYNKFNVAVINNKTFLTMQEDMDTYRKNDLLVIKHPDNKEVKAGDYLFFYDTLKKDKIINYGKVSMVNVVKNGENTFTMDSKYLLQQNSVIGRRQDVKIYKNVGGILRVISSKWVFLIVIIVPIMLIFLYELYLLIMEIKKTKTKA